MAYIDFKEVKRKVSIHQTAQLLHLEMHQFSGGWYRAWCPTCEAHSLIISCAYGLFFCASGKQWGDQLSLYSHVKQVVVREAAVRLGEYYGATILKAPPLAPAPHTETQAKIGGDNASSVKAHAG